MLQKCYAGLPAEEDHIKAAVLQPGLFNFSLCLVCSIAKCLFCNTCRYLNNLNLFIQLNGNDSCICGHPGPSCQPVASIETRSIQPFNEKKRKRKTKHLKQHLEKLGTGNKLIFFVKVSFPFSFLFFFLGCSLILIEKNSIINSMTF